MSQEDIPTIYTVPQSENDLPIPFSPDPPQVVNPPSLEQSIPILMQQPAATPNPYQNTQEKEYCAGVNFQPPSPPWWGQGSIRQFVTERPGSGSLSFSKAGVVGRRIFAVPWVSDKVKQNGAWFTYLDFVQQIMGYCYLDANNNPVVSRPDVFGLELNTLYAQEVSVVGENMMGYEGKTITFPDGTILSGTHDTAYTRDYPVPNLLPVPAPLSPRIVYQYAIVTVTYAPLDFNESFNISAESLMIPGSQFGFLNSNSPYPPPSTVSPDLIATPQVVLFPKSELTIERRFVLNSDILGLTQLPGRVNGNPITIDDTLYPAYALQLQTIEAQRAYYINGNFRVWNFTLRFVIQSNPGGWVTVPRWNPNVYYPPPTLDPGYQDWSSLGLFQYAKAINNNIGNLVPNSGNVEAGYYATNGVPGGGSFRVFLDTDQALAFNQLPNNGGPFPLNEDGTLHSAFERLLDYS